MGKRNNIVVGLDIGTSKVCAVVGEMTERGVEIIGVGSHISQGLRKGVVINIESTVESIKKAVEEAGMMAGCEINSVFTASRAATSRASTATASSRSRTKR
jgi:cell division protein FtsA